MTQVFLVRHGQASAGTDNYDRLSPVGIEQAKLLGDWWKQCGFVPDAVFNGTLERQQHTAQLALEGSSHSQNIETLEGLNEYEHSTIDRLYGEGFTSDGGVELQFDQYLEIMARWRDAPPTDKAQSWESFSNQGWSAIRTIVEAHDQKNASGEHANLVFFTSGGIIATVLQQVLSLSFEATMHALWQTRNASVTNILFNRHGACLVDYNTVAHLHGHARPNLITQI